MQAETKTDVALEKGFVHDRQHTLAKLEKLKQNKPQLLKFIRDNLIGG